MRTFILLSAIPGSGKSTWARKYQSQHPNTYIVSSDQIRKDYWGSVNNFEHEQEVWNIYLNTINKLAAENEDVTVIADATNLQNKYRRYYHDATPGFDKHVLVLFNIPYKVCLIQNTMREKSKIVPKEAMESLRKELEEPTEEILNLYDEVITVTEFSKEVKA